VHNDGGVDHHVAVQTPSLTFKQQASSFPHGIWTGIAMAEDTVPAHTEGGDLEELDTMADRLEAALERIATHLDAAKPGRPPAELVARLDGLIGRLRDALGNPPGSFED
jgi:hypothetical protein